nr:hypothetical protein [Enterococcus faecalis]
MDVWLDKETQKITLKRCFYDTSFKKQTLKELERVIFRLRQQIMGDPTSPLFILKERYSFLELEEKYEEINRFMLDVLEDVYWKELANMPEDRRHLDDWDFF